MSLSVTLESEFWGGVPQTARRQRPLVRSGRSSTKPSALEPTRDLASDLVVELQASLEQAVAYMHATLKQAVTDVMLQSQHGDVVEALDGFLAETTSVWEFLLRARSEIEAKGKLGEIDLVALAREAQCFYPKAVGRAYVRGAIYLNADAVALANSKQFPALRRDANFLVRHDMLLVACLIASENLRVTDDTTEAVACALWDHWAALIQETGVDAPDVVETLIEDAYLKATADEAVLEQADRPWHAWRHDDEDRLGW